MLTLRSPAKVNLFLQIVGRRSDGFHDINSLFQSVSLSDYITFKISNHDSLACDQDYIPIDDTNLIFKAVKLFKYKTKSSLCYEIQLNKNIPPQSGLGGGSGNAATTLWALNELSTHPVKVEKLQEWSSEIGSDIPFFFSHGTALCISRGECVKNYPNLTSQNGVIIRPKTIGLSTPEVFQKLDCSQLPIRNLNNLSISDVYFNDLESPAFYLEPKLKQLKQELIEGGFDQVVMTGSGSALICLGDGHIPNRNDLNIYPLEFINRKQGEWY